jgi:hypothetical protein
VVFHGRKRSEPQGRQQVETPAARARSNPARRCKTARSEQESEGMAAFGRRARRSSTGDPDSRRRSYGPDRIGALGVDARGLVVSSHGERRELREGIRLSGGEPFGWSTEGRRTPGAPQGAGGYEPQERKVEACSHAFGPGTREGLWRGARGQEGRCPVERREAGDRALERSGRPRGPVGKQPVNPDAARQGRGGSEQRPTSSLRVASRMEFCWATNGTVRGLEARVNLMRAGRKAEPRGSRDSAGA